MGERERDVGPLKRARQGRRAAPARRRPLGIGLRCALLCGAALCGAAAGGRAQDAGAPPDAAVGPPDAGVTEPQAPPPHPEAPSPPPTVLAVRVQGAITSATRDYLKAALQAAAERESDALLIELDTPGGLLEATREIASAILESPRPVITWVTPAGARAGSAGTFISLASHVLAMAPTSNIGAAHPVGPFGGDIEGDMAKKVENDAAAFARALAEAHGRDAAWAEQAVRESASITASEAVKQRVADLVADQRAALFEATHNRVVKLRGAPHRMRTMDAQVENFERTRQQELYETLANPGLLYVLLLLGLLGLYIEFNNPGLIVPGVLGAVCLGVVLGLQVLPLNWLGVTLIGLAAVLLIAEIYVPSFGLLSVAAVACLVSGSYLLFEVPGSNVHLDPVLIWGVAGVFTLSVLSLGVAIVRAKRRGPSAGVDGLVGTEVRVTRAIPAGGEGRVFADGSSWLARAPSPLPEGARVRVVGRDGLTLLVRALDDTPPAPET